MAREVVFQSGNTWTSILRSDPFILEIMDKESRYPTPTAELLKWQPRNPDKPGWDGWVRLMRKPAPTIGRHYFSFPTGLVPRLSDICRKYGYTPYCDDQRVRPVEGFPEHLRDGQVIVDRDYQIAACDKGEKIGRGVLDMPPRSGKTRTMVELMRRLSLPTIWTAPTDRIADQTRQVIESFFGPHFVTQLVGTKNAVEASHRRVVVCTDATAAALDHEFYQTREMLAVDEWHHGASKRYTQEIFPKCDHIYFRFGMTGTHFRSGNDALAMHSLLSNVIHKVSSAELLRRGYLVPTRVVYLPMPAHPKLRGVGDTFQSGHGKHGIHIHKGRNQLATHAAFYLWRSGRKVLILVGTKAQGYALQKMLMPFLPQPGAGCQFNSVEFVSTDRPRPKQKQILESYLDNQEVQILIGTSLLGEGVDLPNVDAIVYARGEKAEVSLMQNAYRVCTALPGKRDAIIVDFADRHHRKLKGHSHERLDVYYREPTFSVEVLNSINDFVPWVSGQQPVTM